MCSEILLILCVYEFDIKKHLHHSKSASLAAVIKSKNSALLLLKVKRGTQSLHHYQCSAPLIQHCTHITLLVILCN